ncbi:MAG: D-tyrosyl-tRNA(Tyr) deacylase [bacterium (Candidatus Stahlbacteria) CG23_combo_of_CG06-09_8_20_14_all_34_7]|nr:MAG: D-tyrosyl-tRNA(Tyr) deacylase [bacterium (Candidatus Stahlbacteria) CG23_combo_of_CG06-09_8_20_14_all_34_7]
MKLLIQRVSRASVFINNSLISEIENGLCVFIGFCKDDTEGIIEKGVKKLLNLRIFEDENNKMNKSVKDLNGEVLLISQFTLCADMNSGNRPSFDYAMKIENANILFEKFYDLVSKEIRIKKGVFRSLMDIQLVNHGPATFVLEIK